MYAKNDFAKSALVKVGATVTLAKPKVRGILKGNALQNGRAVAILQLLVFFKRLLVNVNFPTYAAAVLARVCYASKGFVVCGGKKFHKPSFLDT